MPTFYAIQINAALPANYDEKTPYFVGECMGIVGIEKAKRFKSLSDAGQGAHFWVSSNGRRLKHQPLPVKVHLPD